jgi:cell division transport system permease protein
VLNGTPGIAHAAALSDAEINALVEPWIGKDGVVSGIPLPRLIDAAVTPGEDVDVTRLAARLKQAAPHASVDDHRRWIARLRGLADAVRYSAYGILLLIAGATAAAVSFATRAGLDAHHEMVALLHQMGALARFIARAVEWHYFISALFAAALGTLFAGLFFLGAGGLEVLWRGGGALPAAAVAEMERDSMAPGGAGRDRTDRLGDGALLGSDGGQGHLLALIP